MWDALKRWWQTVLDWFGVAAPPSALEVMKDIQRPTRSDEPNSPAWTQLMGQLKSQVFSASDRRRLWKRQWRRQIGGEPRPLDEIRTPTDQELATLRVLVEDLARGR